MKRLLVFFTFALIALVVGGIAWISPQQHTARRVYGKTQEVLTKSILLVKSGGDPAPVFAILKQVTPALDAGHPALSLALAQRALDTANAALRTPPPPSELKLPIDSTPEATSTLYLHPQPVAIEGYTGDAMEPFISPDGRFLFFKNSNDAKVDTNF
jgi:hypothetical protein